MKDHIQIQINEWEKPADFLVWALSGSETQEIFS